MAPRPATYKPTEAEQKLRRQVEGRLIGLRVNRYSWWTHARELADYLLPRRYKWLITPNQMSRGSPINQHILDSTATIAARNLASGIMTGVTNPTRPWIKLMVGKWDSTQSGPIPIWLKQVESMLMLIFSESNFYTAMATFYFDLVIFGTAVLLIYEDFDNVISCINPCFGEYYIDVDGKLQPAVFYREFTMTVSQVVSEFGYDNCSAAVRGLYDQAGPMLTRELIVAHAIEPNNDPKGLGIPSFFKYREVFWEWGGSASPQGGSSYGQGFLRKKGFHENPAIMVRWDIVSNDAYGRSPGMDALPDVKQLQQEVRRKAQAVDKMVNPPMEADIQLKNQPASLLPGGITYTAGKTATGNSGFTSVYGNWRPDIAAVSEDLQEIRARIKQVFFNDILQPISQYETRSNVSATEIDARKAESLIMLGPVLDRIYFEGLKKIIDRTFNRCARAGILPPAPQEIAGKNINIKFISMLTLAQQAAATGGIERTLSLAGSMAGVDASVMDGLDADYTLALYSNLMNNDPRMIRTPEAIAQMRQQRQQQQQQEAIAQQADTAQKLAAGAKTMSETNVGGGQNAIQAMTGIH